MSTAPRVAGVPSLLELSAEVVKNSLTEDNVCGVVRLFGEEQWPADCNVYETALSYVVSHFSEVAEADPEGLKTLSVAAVSAIAESSKMAVSESQLFDVLMKWGGFEDGGPPGVVTSAKPQADLEEVRCSLLGSRADGHSTAQPCANPAASPP